MRRAALLVALALVAGRTILAGQVAPNRALAYLHPSDVHDPRALWVNPAGLGTHTEASVYAELAVGDPGAKGRVRQIDAGFNSRGLALGYQRDLFDDGARGHTYRLGFAGAAGGLAAGFAVARYTGTATSAATGWDLGILYAWRPWLTLGGVIANIGQPVVRGLEQRVTYMPGATWHAPAAAQVSAHARLTSDSVLGYAFGVTWRGVLVRVDTDGGLRRGAFAFGVSIGRADRVGAVGSTSGDVSRLEAASLFGVSTRAAAGSRRP